MAMTGLSLINPAAHALVWQGCQMLLMLAISPALVGLIRKVKARLLSRRGPPVFQPYRELWRLLHKEAVVAEGASPLFRAAPYGQFAATWVAAALVPSFVTGLMFSWSADLIAIVALLGTARFILALAGMDVGTAFGGIGSSREMLFASLAEPALLMITFTVALLAGTTLLSDIADHLLLQPVGLRISLALCLVALMIVALAENGRVPVDNPATHLELTMVHEAMVLEYSGRHLAMIEWAAALKLTAYLSLIACLFVPFGMATSTDDPVAIAIGLGTYFAKLVGLGVAVALAEVVVAKMRVFRVADFVGGAFVLASMATLLLFVSRGF
jgi:formate hydrogenlyase subunit 4